MSERRRVCSLSSVDEQLALENCSTVSMVVADSLGFPLKELPSWVGWVVAVTLSVGMGVPTLLRTSAMSDVVLAEEAVARSSTFSISETHNIYGINELQQCYSDVFQKYGVRGTSEPVLHSVR